MPSASVLLAIVAIIALGLIVFLVARKLGTFEGSARLSADSLEPPARDEDDIQHYVAQGKTIEAIKRVRDTTGMGLKDAKAYVETLRSQAPSDPNADLVVPGASSAVEQEVRHLLAQGRKIEAIKHVRRATGWGLSAAKTYVESLE